MGIFPHKKDREKKINSKIIENKKFKDQISNDGRNLTFPLEAKFQI